MEQTPAAARAELLSGLTLYPNTIPGGLLQVQLPEQVQGQIRYRLLSLVGSKLAEGAIHVTHTGTLLGFDFSRQLRVPGLYYLRLEGANLQHTFKIMRK